MVIVSTLSNLELISEGEEFFLPTIGGASSFFDMNVGGGS